MSILILAPTNSAPAYSLAAKAFQNMYRQVTSHLLPISDFDDGVSDLIVIGSDSVNDYLMDRFLNLELQSLPIRYGTDDYCIQSHSHDQRKVLILAGGRGRSTLYAVYDYFERFAGCHYFWDGDVIPHHDTLPLTNINISEKPRFEFRGTRYFAHRGLKRFQAEHWDFDDWKRELDWLLKKRMNFFMLRIGMDDIWQKAFPDDVPYPEAYQNMDASGFHDRSDFWTLEYRGKLRQQIMDYARDLDLLFPADCGTMTHWYSRTPQAFLDARKPTFVTQELPYYADGQTGSVFDFTKKDMMAYYTKLTETMVNTYDKGTALFHTIGLGERSMYEDPRKNFALKKIAYRRISEEIRTKYPNSKLMLATWDFAGWWDAQQVRELTKELDPEKTIFMDYTCEVADPKSCFLNWGLVEKFPWIFGIFHAFESESEIRGPYERIEERFAVAAKDPFCKGMIYWPELSHSDPLILEYLTENCWMPSGKRPEEIIVGMCKKRYGEYASQMQEVWLTAFPIIKLSDWGSRTQRSPDEPDYEDYAKMTYSHNDIWTRFTLFLSRPDSDDPVLRRFFAKRMKKYEAIKGIAAKAVAALPGNVNMTQHPMVFRDMIDLLRTTLGRYMNLIIMRAIEVSGNNNLLAALKEQYSLLMDLMVRTLSLNSDFSILSTLSELEKSAPVNPTFELTLKKNLCNSYCLQAAYEPASYLFTREIDIGFDWLMYEQKNKDDLLQQREKLLAEFLSKPLHEMQPDKHEDLSTLIPLTASVIRNTEQILF